MAPRYLDRLRALCLALPQTYEKTAWNEPTFRIVNGKIFAMHASSGTHHSPNRPSVWLHASKENQLLMVADRPDRYFAPPYVGPSGWIGVYLDGDVPWEELRELVRDAWMRVAPKKVLVLLDVEGAAPVALVPSAKSATQSAPSAKAAPNAAPKSAPRTASTSESTSTSKPARKVAAKRQPKSTAQRQPKSTAKRKPRPATSSKGASTRPRSR